MTQVAVSPLAAVDAALARAAAVNPVVNALCLVDAESARARARELEARLERGEDTGPLTGWTFTVKDAMRQAGYPSTAGSRSLMDEIPDASTACVARLEAAGAIAIGRSNVPEFCYRGTTRNELYGQTGNPFAPERSAGGSSGGAASALALGVGDLALGSDGGGSIRIPASFCGTVGLQAVLRPRARGPRQRRMAAARRTSARSRAASPTAPARWPSWPARIRSTRSACRSSGMDYVAAARDPGDLSGLRVAYSDDLGYIRLDREVRERFAEAVEAFARATGATVEQAHPGVRLAARGLECHRLRRQQRQRGPVAGDRARGRRRACADRGRPGPERRGIRRGAQPRARDRGRLGGLPRALRPAADPDHGVRRLPARRLGSA